MALPVRLLDLVVPHRHDAACDRRRLERADALRARAARLHPAIGLFRQRPRRLRLGVAGDHENGVLWRVEALVIGERVLALEPLDLVAPADDRNAVGVVSEQRRLHRLAELRAGVGVAMHPPLLEHDVPLGGDDFVGQHEPGHPVGLERHAGLEVLFGDLLEIGGEIIAGEGVLLAADLGDEFGEFALGMGLGALEHQMFEKMGDARLARRIVGGAVAIPDHMRDDRRAVVGNDDDLEAVFQSEMGDLRSGS